ncbi:hypothetical protein FALCPG4_015464 [Fusarium falciforme]
MRSDVVPLPHPCVAPTKTGFLEPTSTSIYKLGDVIGISWFGGMNIQGTPTQSFTLYMKRYRDFSSDENSTVSIVTNEPFTYGEDDGSSSWLESWTGPGPCGTSAFHYQWTIPSTLKLASDNDFVFVAQNVTDDSDQTDYITSDPFLIETVSSSATTLSASSSSSTTQTSDSASTISPVLDAAVSKSLSTGAKAGIGIGVALAAVLLLVGFWLFWRKRSRKKSVAAAGSATGYGKAELAGKSLDPPAVEAGGAELMEADGAEVRRGDEAGIRELIELPSQQFK